MPPDGLVQARVAVVGHVEWVDFAIVSRLPRPGEILHVREFWDEAAGGGAVAAVQMAKLTRGSLFLCALTGERLVPHGDDPLPWDALDDVGGVYFTGGDAAALQAARRADVIVATPRAGD